MQQWHDAMIAHWSSNKNGYRSDDYEMGFREGWQAMLAEIQGRMEEFHCPACSKVSFPDYGCCAFCGWRPK